MVICMIHSIRFLSVVCLFALSTQVNAIQTLVIPVYSQGYDPARDPFSDGREALHLAKETQRRVLIEVGGDWCSWCHILDRFLHEHPAVSKRLHAAFVVLKVNVDETNDNAEFLAAFPAVLGYPHLYITDSDGVILISRDTVGFLQEGKYSAQHLQTFIDRWSIKHE